MAATFPAYSMIRGDVTPYAYKLLDRSGNALPLAGCTILLTVKTTAPQASNVDLDDASAILTAGIAIGVNGVVTAAEHMEVGGIDPETGDRVTSIAGGVVTHTIPKATSDALPIGSYVYDISVTDATGWSETIINAAPWTIAADVGRRNEVL